MPSTKARYALALTAIAAVGCDGIGINEFQPHTGVIQGTVVYPGGTARGNVIITLFAEDRLPPPTGTSGPLNFVIVPEASMFGSAKAGEPGDFSAPFTIPTVPAGRYQIRAFVDADGDFNPLFGLLGQATAGDVGGGFVDPATGAFQIVEVKTDEITADGILVSIGRTFPVERPAFAITSTPTYTVPLATPAQLVLRSHPIMRDQVKMTPELTQFLVQYVDEDGNGAPDDANGDHLPDVYPRVLLRKVVAEGDDCVAPACSVIIPVVTNPLPFLDALNDPARGFALTTVLDLIVPPVSLRVTAEGREIVPTIPPGKYETIVIAGTGQTWQIPNDLDSIQPTATDPTQAQLVDMVAGPALPPGVITGTIAAPLDAEGDAYVIAFDAANPPPPQGTGTPVGLATVPAAAFSTTGTQKVASFTLAGLAPGAYILSGLLDADSSFSPLVSLLSQPSAGDWGTSQPAVVRVTGAGPTAGVGLTLDFAYPFDRPAFGFETVKIQRRALPAVITLDTHPISALGMTADAVRFPVSLTSDDANGDNLIDLLPQVLLTRMLDTSDPRTAPNDPERIIIPATVDPLSFIVPLASGAPLVPAEQLRLILPPVAIRIAADGSRERVAPVPPGRYRINVITRFSQTWSVPSDLDVQLGRVGTGAADPTQIGFVEIENDPIPPGAIVGDIAIAAGPPPDGSSVVVLAFADGDPPPPQGAGRPRAIAVVPAADFGGGATASYALGGLPTGTYQVRAFLDANGSFVPWFDTMSQPDSGDVGGGHLDLQRGLLIDVEVNALMGPTTGVRVTIVPTLAYPVDRPAFSMPTDTVLSRGSGPLMVTIDATDHNSDVLSVEGAFVVQWVDLDGNGEADDFNGDGNRDTFPLVVAELLDPEDPTNQTVATDRVMMFGIVDPRQFTPLGFPVGDITATSSRALTTRLSVAFPPLAIEPDRPANPIPAPAGKYRVTLIGATGQTWSVPNELQRAITIDGGLEAAQSRYLEVRP